jgi:DHA1 family multidrug resistance protein-like MFS transporter
MLMRAMFGGAFIVSAMAFVNSPWQLLALRVMQGCLTGTVAAANVLVVGIVPQANLTMALGLMQTGVYVGNSLGPVVGGLITDFLGHRAAFIGTGGILLLAALIVLKGVREGTRGLRDTTVRDTSIRDTSVRASSVRAAGIRAKTKKKESWITEFKSIASNRDIVLLLSVSFLFQMANTTVNPILPLFLLEIVEDSRYIGSSVGLVLGLGAAAGALGSIISGKFCPRIGYWRMLIICLAGGCAGIAQTFAMNLWSLVVLHLIPSFFLGGIAPALQALLASNTSYDHQGSVFGLNSSAGSTGAAFGPLIGSAAAMLSYRAVFPATAVILVLPLILLLHRMKMKSTRRPATRQRV